MGKMALLPILSLQSPSLWDRSGRVGFLAASIIHSFSKRTWVRGLRVWIRENFILVTLLEAFKKSHIRIHFGFSGANIT